MIDEFDVLRIVVKRLESDDFYIDKDAIKNAIHNKQIFNIIHSEGIVKVDFIVRKDNPYRTIEFQRRRNIVFEDLNIFLTSPEDLILSKLIWAKDSLSEMQFKDVENLMKTVHNLDRDYIEKWIKVLGLEIVYKEIPE